MKCVWVKKHVYILHLPKVKYAKFLVSVLISKIEPGYSLFYLVFQIGVVIGSFESFIVILHRVKYKDDREMYLLAMMGYNVRGELFFTLFQYIIMHSIWKTSVGLLVYTSWKEKTVTFLKLSNFQVNREISACL